MLKKLKDFRRKNWMLEVTTLKTWGHFSILPTILIGYTLDLNGYYSIEIGWGRWFISINLIPKNY